MPQVLSAVESALFALGDGNWKMGEGVQVGQGNKDEDDGSIIEHFIRLVDSSLFPSDEFYTYYAHCRRYYNDSH